jgi:hypothetical protein
MHKLHHRNIENMKKQGTMTPPKAHNSSITESKDTEGVEMLEEEFKTLVLKIISDLKKDLKEQIDEVRKSS